MNILLTILLTLYLCLGFVAGLCLLDYSYGDLDYKANNAQDKEKYHKLRTKIAWISVLGMCMMGIPIIITVLIVII